MKKFIIFFVCIQTVWSQSYLDIYKKVGDQYIDANSFSAELKVKINYTEEAKVADEVYVGMVIKKGENLYTQFADKINIASDNKNVFIDNHSKLILISNYSYDEKNIKKNVFSGFEEETYLEKYNFNILKTENGSSFFEIIPKDTSDVYKKIELTIDSKDWSLKRIWYVMNPVDGNMVSDVEVLYGKTEFNKVEDETPFLLKNYIEFKNKSYQGVGKYAGFKVINQTKL